MAVLLKMISVMNLIKAFIFRDYEIEKTYRFNFIIKTLSMIFQLALFYYISRLVQAENYFRFVFVGLLFSKVFNFWLNSFTENIRHEQYWGTSELIFLSPNSPLKLILSSSFSKFLALVIEIILFLALGRFFFGLSFSFFDLRVLPVALINFAAFGGIGLMSAGFIMYLKRGDPVNWFVSSSFDILSGVYFPLAVLPGSLRFLSGFLPTTSALIIWRKIFIEKTFPSLAEIGAQFLWAVALICIGVIVFKRSFDLTKKKGELGTY
jgi:ABC-2 type transport system permease protein